MHDKRVRLILGIVAIVLLGAGWYFFYFSPLSSKVTQSVQAISVDQGNIATLQSRLNSLLLEKKNLPTLKKDASLLQTALPSSPDLPTLFSSFTKAAAASGLPLINITPTPPSSVAQTPAAPVASGVKGTPSVKSSAPSIAFSIQTEGGYFQVESFLKALDSLGRLVNVQSVSITAAGSHIPGYPSSDGEILNVTIKGQAFEALGAS